MYYFIYFYYFVVLPFRILLLLYVDNFNAHAFFL